MNTSFLSRLIHGVSRLFKGAATAPPGEAETLGAPPPAPAPVAPLDISHLSSVTFTSLKLPESLQRGIQAAGYSNCTPIQALSLPETLAGHDIIGQAQTGTGKTAAFLIALYHRLLTQPAKPERKRTQPRAIVIAPTRELAIQIHRDAENIGRHTGLRLTLVYGGTGFESQRQQLESGTDILIGTPGRLIDYLKQNIYDLRAIQVLVLDEADRMFDLGFIKDIRFMLHRMPPHHQRLSMLFSATLTHRVAELAYEHMNNPKQVAVVTEKITAEKIVESVYFPSNEEKIPLLLGLLKNSDVTRALVFVNTKPVAETLGEVLQGNGYRSGVLSGDVPQNKRQQVLSEFTNGTLKILVATDVAARGLHIPAVSHVFNYDLPQDVEDYVHRIGRTARAGAQGAAISFACEAYAFSLGDIETYIGHKIPVERIESELLVQSATPVRERHYHHRTEHRRPHPNRRPSGGPPRGGRNASPAQPARDQPRDAATAPRAEGDNAARPRRRRRRGPPKGS